MPETSASMPWLAVSALLRELEPGSRTLRRAPVASSSLGEVGRQLCRVQRAGPTAVGLWASATMGLSDAQLHRLRVGSLQSVVRLPRGVSVSLKLSSFKVGRKAGPARFHHGQVLLQWAVAEG